MSFIGEASGIYLSPTGGTGNCTDSNICGEIQSSGQIITIANTCNMPLSITGFHNNNPEKFTIINYPEFSGSGYYTTGSAVGNSYILPKTLAPGETWDILTWWHPSAQDLTGGYGSESNPTGLSQSAKISVLPGDLGFNDCSNYFTLSGELFCANKLDSVDLGTGTLGTFAQSLFDLPSAPITTACLRNSKYVYESFRVYSSSADLGSDQTQGLYQLMGWIGSQISGNVEEYPEIRNIAKGFTTGVRQVIDAGNDNDLANLFTFSIPLADSVLYNPIEGAGDPETGSFKTSTVVPTGSGTLMELGEGYTGINILESRYEDAGAGDAWQNKNNNYGVYVSSGAVGGVNLMARMFIAESGYQSLRAGTTIENSICTEPIHLDLGAAPAVAGEVEGDFDTLAFSNVFADPSPLPIYFNLFIIPNDAALDAFFVDFPIARAQPLVWKTRKGAVICCVKNGTQSVDLKRSSRYSPDLIGATARPIINEPYRANPGDLTKVDEFVHGWDPAFGAAGESVIRAPSIFDLNNNGNNKLRYNTEWIVNGDIEIANNSNNVVAEADGTTNPGNLGPTNFDSIEVKANLTTHGYIRVEFKIPEATFCNFKLRGVV